MGGQGLRGRDQRHAEGTDGSVAFRHKPLHRNTILSAERPAQPTSLHPALYSSPPTPQHTARGILSMANSGPNTNRSQFFITYQKAPHLNGATTVAFRFARPGSEAPSACVSNQRFPPRSHLALSCPAFAHLFACICARLQLSPYREVHGVWQNHPRNGCARYHGEGANSKLQQPSALLRRSGHRSVPLTLCSPRRGVSHLTGAG